MAESEVIKSSADHLHITTYIRQIIKTIQFCFVFLNVTIVITLALLTTFLLVTL